MTPEGFDVPFLIVNSIGSPDPKVAIGAKPNEKCKIIGEKSIERTSWRRLSPW
jgi:hypothetical protein